MTMRNLILIMILILIYIYIYINIEVNDDQNMESCKNESGVDEILFIVVLLASRIIFFQTFEKQKFFRDSLKPVEIIPKQ